MNTPKQPSFMIAAFPLFLAILLDSMGLGLIIPTLNTLLTNPQAGFFTEPVSAATAKILFGLTISLFMFCWFFGSAYLGDLSDAIGRKKSLSIALIGAFIGYLISAIGVGIHSYALLLTGRVISGFTSGSQSIAQAAIVDISPAEMKARNLGLILFAASLGFVLGPMCGAFFSDSSIWHGFNFATPLYFAAVTSLINVVLLLFLFKETFSSKSSIHFQFHRAISIFISAFKETHVRYLSIVLFLMILGWSSYYSFISMYLNQHFHQTNNEVNLFMALMACGFGLGFSVIVNSLTRRFSLKTTTIISLVIAGMIMAASLIGNNVLTSWILVAPIGVFVAVSYSILLTLFSNQVDEDSQGWVMGITNSVMALGFAITGFTSSILADIHITLPIWWAAAFLMLSGFGLYGLKHKIN